MRVRKARIGTANRVVPVSTMAWHPKEQATGAPLKETLGRGMQGEPGLPQNTSWGAGNTGNTFPWQSANRFQQRAGSRRCLWWCSRDQWHQRGQSSQLRCPWNGGSIWGGSQPTNTPIPIGKWGQCEGGKRRNPQQLWLGFTCSGRQRKDAYPRGFLSSCCQRQGWLRRKQCLGMPIPGCRQRGCSRRNPLAPSQPAQKSGCGR